MHTISSIVISQDRRLITSSREVWWEFSRETSSQVRYSPDESNMPYMLT